MLKNIFSENNFISIFIIIILVVFSLLISEIIKKRYPKLNNEFFRKIPHILIGIIFTLSPLFLNQSEIIISSIILFFGIFISKFLSFFQSAFSVKRISIGVWLMPISLGVLAHLWLPQQKEVFMTGMLVLGLSDSFAAIFGKLWAKRKIPFSKKSYLGSFIFFFTTLIILFLFSNKIEILNLLWISIILTFVELLFIWGLDNLFIPITTSYLFYLFLM